MSNLALKRFLLWLMRAALLALVPFLPALAHAKEPNPADQPKIHWRTATLAPKGVGWALTFEKVLVPVVAQCTNNQGSIKIYWGGIMGEEDDYIQKMRLGQLEGAGLSARGAGLACPEIVVLELPFLFCDYQEVDYVRERTFDIFNGFFRQRGFKLLLWVDQDFDQVYSLESPMANLADFQSARFVTWYGPVEQSLFRAFRAESIAIEMNQIPTAVRTGKVNAVMGPAVWVVGSELFQKFRYVNPMKIRYSPGVIVVTRETWEALPPGYRACYAQKRATIESQFNAATRVENEKSLEALYLYGLKKTSMTPESMGKIKKRAMGIYTQLSGTVYSARLLTQIQTLLEDCRSKKNAAAKRKSHQ